MTAQITLSTIHTAQVETSHYGEDRPVIVVFENGRRTPGQWFASTIVERGPAVRPLAIDFGANWWLTGGEAALLYGFAVGVLAAAEQR